MKHFIKPYNLIIIFIASIFLLHIDVAYSQDTLRDHVGQADGDDTFPRMSAAYNSLTNPNTTNDTTDVIVNNRKYTYPAGDFDITVSNPNNNYYKTSQGAVSVGMSMLFRPLYPNAEDYPSFIIAPHGNWTGQDGTNLMQIYFSIACNFFIHKRNGIDNPKTKIVCTPEQKSRIIEYLKLGNPYELPNIADYYSEELIKRFKKEAIYLADRAKIEGKIRMADTFADMIEFEIFSPETNEAVINNLIIKDQGDGTFLVRDEEKQEVLLDGNNMKELELSFDGVKPLSEIPEFGTTSLGTSSGMDANGLSVGQIIWAGKNHILIDVGIPTISALSTLGLDPGDISHIVITHMHEDHVSGALKYFEQCKKNNHPICLIMEPGIYELFKRQVKQILNKELEEVYDIQFMPLNFYEKMTVGKGDDALTIESIPGFHGTPVMMSRYTYKGKTISHSSDTVFDPVRFEKIINNDIPDYIRSDLVREVNIDENETVFDRDRAEELSNALFSKNSYGNMPSVAIFEGGNAASLDQNMSNHTTPFSLATLPNEIQETIQVNHTAKLPEGDDFSFRHASPMNTTIVGTDRNIDGKMVDFSLFKALNNILKWLTPVDETSNNYEVDEDKINIVGVNGDAESCTSDYVLERLKGLKANQILSIMITDKGKKEALEEKLKDKIKEGKIFFTELELGNSADKQWKTLIGNRLSCDFRYEINQVSDILDRKELYEEIAAAK